MYFLFGFMLGIAFSNIVVGLVITLRSNRPKRNCDVGTTEEKCYRFDDYCAEHADLEGYDMCKGCPLENTYHCRIAWMNLPYKKED